MQDLMLELEEMAVALPRDAAWLAAVLALLFAARLLKAALTPYRLREQMTEKDNPAVGMSVAGYYVGVLAVCLGPLLTPPTDRAVASPWWEDLLVTMGYTALGIVLLNVSRVLLDRLLLIRFSTTKELVDDRNPGVGAVEGGCYVASGLIIAGSLHGTGGGPHTALAFFALGQLVLILYGHLYRLALRWLGGFDVFAEIERDNVAAGVAFALNLVAMGVILMRAGAGDFADWPSQLVEFGRISLLGVVLLLVLRFLVNLLLLPGVRVRSEIVEDQNTNVAWVEGVVLTGLAALLIALL